MGRFRGCESALRKVQNGAHPIIPHGRQPLSELQVKSPLFYLLFFFFVLLCRGPSFSSLSSPCRFPFLVAPFVKLIHFSTGSLIFLISCLLFNEVFVRDAIEHVGTFSVMKAFSEEQQLTKWDLCIRFSETCWKLLHVWVAMGMKFCGCTRHLAPLCPVCLQSHTANFLPWRFEPNQGPLRD